jgi:hypothetical protein
MVKRAIFMLASILAALAVGIGVAMLDTNPKAQIALVTIAGLSMWAIATLLNRNGDLWYFSAPYS